MHVHFTRLNKIDAIYEVSVRWWAVEGRKNYEKTGRTELYMVTRVCQRFQWTRFISLLDESKMVFTFAKVFAFFCGHRVSCFWAIFKPLYLIICQQHKFSSRKYPGLELLLIYYFFSEFKTKMKEPGPWLRQPKSRSCHFMLPWPEACHLFINTVLVRSLQIGLVRDILLIFKNSILSLFV